MSETHLPLAPLLEAMGCETHAAAARSLPVTRRTICRWARDGIPPRWADPIAVAVGKHPVEIWDDWQEVEEEYQAWRAAIRPTHCKRGHEYTPENTRYRDGGRVCLACRRILEAPSRKRAM